MRTSTTRSSMRELYVLFCVASLLHAMAVESPCYTHESRRLRDKPIGVRLKSRVRSHAIEFLAYL